MTVYVDQGSFPANGRRWCHLFTDGPDAELHAFAKALGLKREWFQAPPRARWKHYDLVVEKRDRALRMGAVVADRPTLLRIAHGQKAAAKILASEGAGA